MPGPHEALSAALDSWNAGDLDGYLRLYDEGICLHGYSPEPMGKAQVRGFYEGIFSAFDTPELSFEEVLWDGDVCAIRFAMTGRHVQEFMGVPDRNGDHAARHHDLALPGRPGRRAVLPGRHAGPARAGRSGARARISR